MGQVTLGLRTCKACHETKALADFTVHRRSPGGRRSVCRACRRARRPITELVGGRYVTKEQLSQTHYIKREVIEVLDTSPQTFAGWERCGKGPQVEPLEAFGAMWFPKDEIDAYRRSPSYLHDRVQQHAVIVAEYKHLAWVSGSRGWAFSRLLDVYGTTPYLLSNALRLAGIETPEQARYFAGRIGR